MPGEIRGRLAPSPTGRLHLGNAWAFLLAWLSARACGGTLVSRLEDIDPERSKDHYAQAIIEDLAWLGLDWDAGVGVCSADERGPYRQSERGHVYAAILDRLARQGLTYPCFCSRRELRLLAAAPHIDDVGAPYPGTCRHLSAGQREERLAQGRPACLRLRCPPFPIAFADAVQGPQNFLPEHYGGDFALRRSDGVIAYQLAVAVDDALMGITQVVRGRDILPSTPRQIALLEILGYPPPQYVHFPLLLDAEGQRLAKRHHSLTLHALRNMGVPPRRLIGFLGYKAGFQDTVQEVSPAELLPAFDLARLPRHDVRIDENDMRHLTHGGM